MFLNCEHEIVGYIIRSAIKLKVSPHVQLFKYGQVEYNNNSN